MSHSPSTELEERCRGAVLGLALGDALGAPHEGGPIERLLWRWIGSTRDGRRRFTDDTQMALDLADSLLRCGKVDQDDLAKTFAGSYRWSRGYGPAAAHVLKRIRSGRDWREANRSVHRTGSFGNGGAMRAPIVGVFFHAQPENLAAAARQTAEVTHAHPLAMDGAAMIAVATSAALAGADARTLLDRARQVATQPEYAERFAIAADWLTANAPVSPRDVRARLGMGITALASCVTALYLAGRFRDQPFEAMLAFTAAAGGDVDTVSAMAGALWGAANGAAKLPAAAIARLEAAEQIDAVGRQLVVARRADPRERSAADKERAATSPVRPLTESVEDTIRSGILRLLELIADPAAQERYERDVPMANVPAELVSMWFDDQYQPASSSFRAAFTAAELQLLAEFHQFYDSRTSSLPSSRRVRDLHRCRAWTEIMAMAASVRSRIR